MAGPEYHTDRSSRPLFHSYQFPLPPKHHKHSCCMRQIQRQHETICCRTAEHIARNKNKNKTSGVLIREINNYCRLIQVHTKPANALLKSSSRRQPLQTKLKPCTRQQCTKGACPEVFRRALYPCRPRASAQGWRSAPDKLQAPCQAGSTAMHCLHQPAVE